MKLITVYNLSLVVFNSVVFYQLLGFLSENQSISGFEVETDEHARKWLRMHAFARVSHMSDLIYTIMRSDRAHFSSNLFFFGATIYLLWGVSLDNEVIFGNGAICFTAMMNSLLYGEVRFYWSIATWGKFITPGAS